jgi:mycothiol system anti-sigma-R factor
MAGRECDDALHEVYDLLSGELDDAKRATIQTHLDECPPCGETYDFYAELRLVVQQKCRDTAPPELLLKIQAAMAEIDLSDA